jgi:signal peptide peptidase sppA, 67K type
MKDFLKSALASALGVLIFCLCCFAFMIMSIIGMIASADTETKLKDNSVLTINLSGTISEMAAPDMLGFLSGNTIENNGLNDMLLAIRKAKNNDDIKGIYLEAGPLAAGFSTLQELRDALADFKKSGKWIVAYGDTYTQGCYYVASVANHIFLNPQGQVDWHGLSSQPYYIKDLAAKFGVKYQVAKVGTFKSATEMFTETKMSDANRLQVSTYLNGLWGNVCKAVSESRKISIPALNTYADEYQLFADAQSLVKKRFVDKLLYADQVKGEVKKLIGIDADESINQVGVTAMCNVSQDVDTDDGTIAIYYAEGEIVQIAPGGMFNNSTNIVSKDICKNLEDLKNDDDIKAVVLRINSPGGDAYASEQIWHQVTELRKKKPVVVSMGDYAASGGYYMSCGANWIVAEPNTLTGSIGIFGVFPDLSGLVTEKLGVKFDEVKTNANSTFGNVAARPFNASEMAMLQGYINRGYATFLNRVSQGRKMPVTNLDKIAQGRVWLGADALKIKLVDQLGGIKDAVEKAAQLAKIKDYGVSEYPAPASWQDQLFNSVVPRNTLDEQLRLTLGAAYEPFMLIRKINQREAIQARLPLELNIR